MTGPAVVMKHHHGRHGWAHRVALPDADPFRNALADLWSVHLYGPDGPGGIIYSFTVELTAADLFHEGQQVVHHTLWVTQQPMPATECTNPYRWLPGYVHLRYEFEPATSVTRLGWAYRATHMLVLAAVDHGGMWFTRTGLLALMAAERIGDLAFWPLGIPGSDR